MRWTVTVATIACVHAAHAEPQTQVQADLGLAVVGGVYEHPVGAHLALGFEAQVFSTYFLPWFSAGSSLAGYGGELRLSWFARDDHHGLYVAPYLRVDDVSDGDGSGLGYCAGTFIGWAFPLTGRLDARVGAGAQYMHYVVESSKIDTPFIALDLVVGYRL